MKKTFILAVLSSSMIFAGKAPVVVPAKATVQIVKDVIIKPSSVQSCNVMTAINYLKAHKFVVGSAAVVAGFAMLYYTNAEFRAMVRGWLGLDVEVAQ